MKKLQQLKDEAREEFDKHWTEIMGLETDPDGEENMYLIYEDEQVINAIDFSPELLGVKSVIDDLITKAYEAGKKEAIEAISREEGWEESQEYYEGKLLNKE